MNRILIACLVLLSISAQAAEVIPPACTGEKAKWVFDVYLNGMYENKALALGPGCAVHVWGITDSQFAGAGLIEEFEKKAIEGCERRTRGGRCHIYMRNNEVVGDPAVAEHPVLSKTEFGLAIAAYGRKDYGTAFRLMKAVAERGSADAQFQIAGFYIFGKGVARNLEEGELWLKKAADQGNESARFALDVVRARGWPRGIDEFKEWTHEKAEQGFVAAQSSLGTMYGNKKDWANAIVWHTKAAERGFGRSQYLLGLIHSRGLGTPRDYVRGYMWFSLSVSNLPLGDWRDIAIGYRGYTATLMTSAQLAEARELVALWK